MPTNEIAGISRFEISDSPTEARSFSRSDAGVSAVCAPVWTNAKNARANISEAVFTCRVFINESELQGSNLLRQRRNKRKRLDVTFDDRSENRYGTDVSKSICLDGKYALFDREYQHETDRFRKNRFSSLSLPKKIIYPIREEYPHALFSQSPILANFIRASYPSVSDIRSCDKQKTIFGRNASESNSAIRFLFVR